MTDKSMTQVSLKRGTSHMVTFIESWAAKVGNQVEILDTGKEMWDIIGVGSTTNVDRSRDFKQFQGSTRGGGIDQ